jgi:protein FrlC
VFLAYSTNGFTRTNLAAALNGIAAAGYAGVEILADHPHWSPAEATPAALNTLRDRIRALGLRVSNINANTAVCLWPAPPPEPVFEPSLSNADPAVRARRAAYTRAAIDLAVAVGAPCVSVTSGRTQADVPPEQGLEHFAEALLPLCDYAAERGVRLGIEYEPALLVERAAEVVALIERVGHPALGVNLDVGHAVCIGEDPVDSIARLAGRIWNVHVEDIRDGKHHHRIPGDGDLDFAALFRALGAIGYTGGVTVELYTCSAIADEAARRAHGVLAPLLAAVPMVPGA